MDDDQILVTTQQTSSKSTQMTDKEQEFFNANSQFNGVSSPLVDYPVRYIIGKNSMTNFAFRRKFFGESSSNWTFFVITRG